MPILIAFVLAILALNALPAALASYAALFAIGLTIAAVAPTGRVALRRGLLGGEDGGTAAEQVGRRT